MTKGTDDFFGGAPSLSWARQDANGEWVDIPELLNVVRGGVVTAIGEPVQMTEFGTGKPLWWQEPTPDKQGEPKVKVIVTLRCDGSGKGIDERDRTDPSDLGERQLHVQSKDMRDAIGAACRKVGVRGVRLGGELYVAWTGKRPSKIKNAKAARTWAALFVAPTVDVTDDGRGGPFQGAGQQPPAAQSSAGTLYQGPAAPPSAQQPVPAVAAPPAASVPPWERQAPAAPAASTPPWEQPPTGSPFGN
jgi:hypothetical protein